MLDILDTTIELLYRYFFQGFQTQVQNSNTADQLFVEDVFQNIYGNTKVFWKTTLPGERGLR